MTHHFDPVTRSCGEVPDAILPARIGVRIIWAADLAVGCRNLMFATTFLTVVFVFVQREPVVTRALVRSGCVFALMLTASVIDGTLVHVCENGSR